jgi:hypothetical protein
MDILTLHRTPKLNNQRRKWLRQLQVGDRVFACSYTDYMDKSGYGKGEFEEGYVLAKDSEITVQFEDDSTLRYTLQGQWIDCEGDVPSNSAWIISGEGDTARQLRRIIATAKVLAPKDEQKRAAIRDQLRRMLSGVNGPGYVQKAERILTYAVRIQEDLGEMERTTFYNDEGIDPLEAAA